MSRYPYISGSELFFLYLSNDVVIFKTLNTSTTQINSENNLTPIIIPTPSRFISLLVITRLTLDTLRLDFLPDVLLLRTSILTICFLLPALRRFSLTVSITLDNSPTISSTTTAITTEAILFNTIETLIV